MKQRVASTVVADWLLTVKRGTERQFGGASAPHSKITGGRPQRQRNGLRASQLLHRNSASAFLRQHSAKVR